MVTLVDAIVEVEARIKKLVREQQRQIHQHIELLTPQKSVAFGVHDTALADAVEMLENSHPNWDAQLADAPRKTDDDSGMWFDDMWSDDNDGEMPES